MLNFQVVFLKTVYQNLYSLMLMETHCLSDSEVALLMMVVMIAQVVFMIVKVYVVVVQ